MSNSLSLWSNELFSKRHPLNAWGDFSDFYHAVEKAYNPSCDVKEDEKRYVFHFDLPGVDKEKIKVELKDNILKVTGKREQEKREETETHLFAERECGDFYRSFEFPLNVDSEKISASHKDGVLTIIVPKAESAQPKQIRVA